MWRLNVGLLNNEQRKKRKTETEENDGTIDPTILRDAIKAVIREN